MTTSYRIEIINNVANEPYYIFSSQIQNNPVESFSFELLYSGGCGSAEIKLAKRLALKNQIELFSQVRIYLQNSSTPYWVGYVDDVPHWASSELEMVIKCKGYKDFLEFVIEENTAYPSATDTKTGLIIDDFANKVSERTVIIYNATKIPLTTDGSNTRGVTFKLASFKSIFEQVAMAHGRYTWGVDEVGEFYCKAPISSTASPLLTLVVGKDVEDFKIKKSLNKRYNELFVTYGNATTGFANRYRTISSLISQTDLNQKISKVFSAPSMTRSADADLWATQKLNDALEPMENVTLELINPKQFLFPYGNVRIIPQRKASGETLERIVFEEVIPNNLSSANSTNYTQIAQDSSANYAALLKFNSGKFSFVDKLFLMMSRPSIQDEITIEVQLWTTGGDGKPLAEIPITDYNAPTSMRRIEIHARSFSLAGPFVFNASVLQNTDYWIVYKFISKKNGGQATPRWGHNNTDSGATKIWKSSNGTTWTAINNFTTIHRLMGEARREGFLQLQLKSVKYQISADDFKCSLGLGEESTLLPIALMQSLIKSIKKIDELQTMWS